jgi:hypothetical protein
MRDCSKKLRSLIFFLNRVLLHGFQSSSKPQDQKVSLGQDADFQHNSSGPLTSASVVPKTSTTSAMSSHDCPRAGEAFHVPSTCKDVPLLSLALVYQHRDDRFSRPKGDIRASKFRVEDHLNGSQARTIGEVGERTMLLFSNGLNCSTQTDRLVDEFAAYICAFSDPVRIQQLHTS